MTQEKYPSAIYLIVAMEFCSRFAFCGMRTLLSLYLRNVLLLPEAASTVLYHVFIMVCFTVPVLGAVAADGCLGRFQTILQFSIICTIGHVLAFLTATPPVGINTVACTMVGLALVAIGAGGVKPCAAAFGGDQFSLPQQKHLLQPFFSLFYFTANLGGLVGMLTTPLLRKAVSCFGDESCYALGFGLPAVAAVLSVTLFLGGKPLYRIKAPKENIMGKFICCAVYALVVKIRTRRWGDKKRHWLDHAGRKYDAALIRDMKAVLAIFLLFVPLPIFWSLLVQQGSRWTFQATRMDGHILGLEILPDQVQAVSPAVVLLLIPLFNKAVYPCLENCHFLVSPLERMAAGGMIAGLAFTCAGVLELQLQPSYPPLPPSHGAQIMLINTLPCDLHVEPGEGHLQPLPNSQTLIMDVAAENATRVEFGIFSPARCGASLFEEHSQQTLVEISAGETKTIIVGVRSAEELETYTLAVEDLRKPLSGRPKIRLIFIRGENVDASSVSLYDEQGANHFYFVGTQNFAVSNYTELHSGRYTYYVTYSDSMDEEFEGFLDLRSGGVYSLILREYNNKIVFAQNFALTPPNHVHILWLVPQYVLISIAEVLFAISGLEFCFTQAPKSMKTVTMAAWYFTVACGNLLVILITQAHVFTSQASEFFLFTTLLILDMALFRWMCTKYQGRAPENDESFTTMDDADDTYPILGLPSHQVIHS